MLYDKEEIVGDWIIYNFAANYYVAYLKDPNYLAMLGSPTEVKSQLQIPFPHRLVRLLVRHTDSSNNDIEDSLDIALRREKGQMFKPEFKDNVFYDQNVTAKVTNVRFGEAYEFEPTIWTVGFTSTATNRIYPVLYFQRLGRDER